MSVLGKIKIITQSNKSIICTFIISEATVLQKRICAREGDDAFKPKAGPHVTVSAHSSAGVVFFFLYEQPGEEAAYINLQKTVI